MKGDKAAITGTIQRVLERNTKLVRKKIRTKDDTRF